MTNLTGLPSSVQVALSMLDEQLDEQAVVLASMLPAERSMPAFSAHNFPVFGRDRILGWKKLLAVQQSLPFE